MQTVEGEGERLLEMGGFAAASAGLHQVIRKRKARSACRERKARSACREQHESEFIVSESATRYFKAQGISKLPASKTLQAEIKQLTREKNSLSPLCLQRVVKSYIRGREVDLLCKGTGFRSTEHTFHTAVLPFDGKGAVISDLI